MLTFGNENAANRLLLSELKWTGFLYCKRWKCWGSTQWKLGVNEIGRNQNISARVYYCGAKVALNRAIPHQQFSANHLHFMRILWSKTQLIMIVMEQKNSLIINSVPLYHTLFLIVFSSFQYRLYADDTVTSCPVLILILSLCSLLYLSMTELKMSLLILTIVILF